MAVLFLVGTHSATLYYACCVLGGFAAGYWAVFVTVGAEQFGTNLRATAATTVPNFVRGMVPLLTTSFTYLGHKAGLPVSAMVVGGVTVAIAFLATFGLEETFGKALGPVLGQRVADAGRQLLAFPAYAAERLSQSVGSYARDEAGLLATGRDFRQWQQGVLDVTARVDALAARIDALVSPVRPIR